MKIFYTLLIALIVLNCLFFELEAKKIKGEKVKAVKVKEKIHHKHVKPEQHEPKKPTETITPNPTAVKAEKPTKHTVEKVEIIEDVIPKKSFKPRSPKVLSEYDKCKLECKKKRDQVSAEEYVEQLTEELKLAKEHLAEQKREADLASQNQEAEKLKIEDHLEDVPIVEKPIIEVTLHQTVKDEV